MPEVDSSAKSPTTTQSLIQAFVTNLHKWRCGPMIQIVNVECESCQTAACAEN